MSHSTHSRFAHTLLDDVAETVVRSWDEEKEDSAARVVRSGVKNLLGSKLFKSLKYLDREEKQDAEPEAESAEPIDFRKLGLDAIQVVSDALHVVALPDLKDLSDPYAYRKIPKIPSYKAFKKQFGKDKTSAEYAGYLQTYGFKSLPLLNKKDGDNLLHLTLDEVQQLRQMELYCQAQRLWLKDSVTDATGYIPLKAIEFLRDAFPVFFEKEFTSARVHQSELDKFLQEQQESSKFEAQCRVQLVKSLEETIRGLNSVYVLQGRRRPVIPSIERYLSNNPELQISNFIVQLDEYTDFLRKILVSKQAKKDKVAKPIPVTLPTEAEHERVVLEKRATNRGKTKAANIIKKGLSPILKHKKLQRLKTKMCVATVERLVGNADSIHELETCIKYNKFITSKKDELLKLLLTYPVDKPEDLKRFKLRLQGLLSFGGFVITQRGQYSFGVSVSRKLKSKATKFQEYYRDYALFLTLELNKGSKCGEGDTVSHGSSTEVSGSSPRSMSSIDKPQTVFLDAHMKTPSKPSVASYSEFVS